MTPANRLATALLGVLTLSSTPARAVFTDFSDIPAGTSFTSPGEEFFSGSIFTDSSDVIRFETALFNDPFSPPPGFNRVDIDLSENLGFDPNELKFGNHLYLDSGSVIIDLAGSVGTQINVSIHFKTGSGIINFDVNNTDPNTVLAGTETFDDLADGIIRNGVHVNVRQNNSGEGHISLFGQVDSVFLGGQDILIGSISARMFVDGDLNGDNFVGIEDLNIILGAWNQNVTPNDWLLGDPSGDGFVGISDLFIVRGNWNAGIPPTPPATGSTVPEPTAMGLVLMGCFAIMGRRGKYTGSQT